jgi:Uma2 family endonuclease
LATVEQYLSTAYSPDCEYVDGVVLERHVGERNHSTVLGELSYWLHSRRRELGIWVYQTLRVRVKPTRVRVPDVCVFVGEEPREEVPTKPPFLCIEILSPDDRMSELLQKIGDYLDFGVRYVWVIDPNSRRTWVHTAEGSHEVRDPVLRTDSPDIAVPLAEIFAEL